MIDQGSEPFLDHLKPLTKKVDVVIQGIANRISDEAIINGYIKGLDAQIFIPNHFDNFIFGFDLKADVSYLPGIKIVDLIGN